MKIIAILSLLLMTACAYKVPGHVIHGSVEVCKDDGGVSYIYYNSGTAKDLTYVTCANGSRENYAASYKNKDDNE